MQDKIERAGYDYSTQELKNRLICGNRPAKLDTFARREELFSAIDLWNAFEAGAEWMQNQLKPQPNED